MSNTPIPTSRPPSPTPSLFVAPDRVDTPPRAIEMYLPIYPERALRDRARGLVELRVLISETGIPLEVKVEKAARADITDAAVTAARQWRFEPARKDGRAVRTHATLRFPFEGVQFARTPFPATGAIPPSPPPGVTPPSP